MRGFILFSFLFSLSSFAQERHQLNGKVAGEEEPLENVHIRNISTKSSVLTREGGLFSLVAEAGDTLVFTHVAKNDLIYFVSTNDIERNYLDIHMTAFENELDEVVVDKNNNISALSVGIVQQQAELLSVNERQLKAAGNFKPNHLFGILFGGLNLNSILNAINGRTSRLKKNILIEKKIENRIYLETNYFGLLKDQTKLRDQDFEKYVDMVLEAPQLQGFIYRKDHEGMKFFLLDQLFEFERKLGL